MPKEIFTPQERRILELYRNPKASGLGRATRLSIQYLVGAGLFTYLAIAYNSWFALVIYLTFVAFVAIRLIGARRTVGVMPNVLAKYEARIAELESRIAELEIEHTDLTAQASTLGQLHRQTEAMPPGTAIDEGRVG
jgi:hypothetical protein